jgi:hypothetical protein
VLVPNYFMGEGSERRLDLGQAGAALDGVRAMGVPSRFGDTASLMPASFAARFTMPLTARSATPLIVPAIQ